MNTKTVIEQAQLRGSNQDGFLQKVATVYLDGEEYRVLAPPKAVGEALDWIHHFSVRQPDKESLHSEILIDGVLRVLAIKLVKEELEKMKAAGRSTREGNRKQKLHELLDDLSCLRLCGPSDDPDEQTAAIESYRYLLINIKALSGVCYQVTYVNNWKLYRAISSPSTMSMNRRRISTQSVLTLTRN